MSFETTRPLGGHPVAAPAAPPLPDDPVEAIGVTIRHLSGVVDLMGLAMTEVLSVAAFCGNARSAAVSLSVVACDERIAPADIDPVTERLYRDAQHGLAALSRTGKHGMAAMTGLTQAGDMLQQLAARLHAQRLAARRAVRG